MIEELTRACVHCGFCLPTCPTYLLWNEEMDSPRGRIQLMEKTAQGTLALSPTVTEHFDRCLGCMACVTSCPSGVRYDLLIEETRATVEERQKRPRAERLQRRLLFATLPHPRRMRWALRLAPVGRRLPTPAWARPMLDLAPRWRSSEQPAPVTPCVESTQAPRRVGLLTGCVQSVVFGEVNAATARTLAAAGHEVVAPSQGCCGALSAHAGRADESARFTDRLRRSFDGLDTIVVNASGCGSHLKEKGLPALDVTEALRDAELPELHPLELSVAYQDSCHLRHAQRLPAAWMPVLGADPGPPRRPARRAGHLLRLGRDLQRHAAGGRPRPGRPEGRPCPGDRVGRVRERQSRLPRPGRAGARQGRPAASGLPPGGAPRRVDPRSSARRSCSRAHGAEPPQTRRRLGGSRSSRRSSLVSKRSRRRSIASSERAIQNVWKPITAVSVPMIVAACAHSTTASCPLGRCVSRWPLRTRRLPPGAARRAGRPPRARGRVGSR